MRTRKLLKFSIALNIFFIILATVWGIRRISLYLKEKKQLENQIEFKSIQDWTAYLYSFPISDSDIVFIGSSITARFPLQDAFNNIHIKNRGISGNTTIDVLNRLNPIIEKEPRKIFLMIGINDINIKVPVDTVFNHFKQITDRVRQYPRITLYVQSVLPTTGGYANSIPSIVEYNRKIKTYCKESKINYIDLYATFLKGNTLDSNLTFDGLHPNGKGYQLWADQIRDYVN